MRCAFVGLLLPVAGQELTVEEILTSDDFLAEGLPNFAWTPDGTRMTWVQPSATGLGDDLVAFDPATGTGETLVAASELIPGGERRPIALESGYARFQFPDRPGQVPDRMVDVVHVRHVRILGG